MAFDERKVRALRLAIGIRLGVMTMERKLRFATNDLDDTMNF